MRLLARRLIPLSARLLTALPLLVSATAHADAPAKATFAVQRSTLDNGLEVLIEEAHRAPLVGIQLTYRTGVADDPAGRAGMTRLVRELLADPSTRHVGRKVVGDMFRALGVEHWPTTVEVTLDRTSITLGVPANELELALWWLSDQMGFGLDGMDQPTITSKRDGLESTRQHERERAAYGAVPALVRHALWPEGHPYRAGLLGEPGDLASITATELRTFVREHYGPGSATLVLAGDVDVAAVKASITKLFGPIPRTAPPARGQAPAVTLDGEKRIKIEAAVDHPRVVVAWPSPALFAEGDQALDAAYHLLADAHRGRLARRLVDGAGGGAAMATDVSARQRSAALGSQFDIDVTVAAGHTVDEVLKVIDEETEKLRATPLGDAELATVTRELVRNTAFGSETILGRAGQIGYFNHYRGDASFLNTYLAGYSGISPADVQRAVTNVLANKKRVVAIVTPTPAAPKGGRLVGGGS